MKPKRNYKTSIKEPADMDLCQTPPYALAPILRYIPTDWILWDPGCGEGILANALRVAGYTVQESDITLGQDFFEYEPPKWDCIVTNPPFGIKPAWVRRCYELNKPFALLMPTEFQGTINGGEQFRQDGISILNMYPRVCFKMPHNGWFSSSQFPVSWFHRYLYFTDSLEFYFLQIPKRDIWKIESRVKHGKNMMTRIMGWGDWIERPIAFDRMRGRFEYEGDVYG